MRACVFTVPQLIYGGKLDFLVFDYLSEITMSLLTAARSKSPVSVREDAGDKDDDDDDADEDTVLLPESWFCPRLCPSHCSVHQ